MTVLARNLAIDPPSSQFLGPIWPPSVKVVACCKNFWNRMVLGAEAGMHYSHLLASRIATQSWGNVDARGWSMKNVEKEIDYNNAHSFWWISYLLCWFLPHKGPQKIDIQPRVFLLPTLCIWHSIFISRGFFIHCWNAMYIAVQIWHCLDPWTHDLNETLTAVPFRHSNLIAAKEHLPNSTPRISASCQHTSTGLA